VREYVGIMDHGIRRSVGSSVDGVGGRSYGGGIFQKSLHESGEFLPALGNGSAVLIFNLENRGGGNITEAQQHGVKLQNYADCYDKFGLERIGAKKVISCWYSRLVANQSHKFKISKTI